MTVTYCTSLEVAQFIWRDGDGTDFSTSTNPTKAHVEQLINDAEDRIDSLTSHSWRSVSVSEEIHDYVIDPRPPYSWMVMGAAYLNHRKLVNPLVSGTDTIEIWNGSEWIDIILAANGYTEGRADDYWIDHEKGVIYFINIYPLTSSRSVRATYRYGDTSVTNSIRSACVMMVAIDLIGQDDRTILLPEGTDNLRLPSKIEEWRKDIATTIEHNSELLFV